ncbi:hypothetical protein QFC21_003444 [Naganishia friedmannii]|uniref:Uncharacterized protein n=1 Tax=Naganishia friedmannii TaxID=89922 RepID=A0ACC2VQ59_9TREE|nr:hypothetical protein QFC21_003444 [Naganishia friedmannii]
MPPSPPDPSNSTSFLDLSPPRSGIGLLKPPTPREGMDRSYSLPLPRPPSREREGAGGGKITRNKLRKKTSRLFGLSSATSSTNFANNDDEKDSGGKGKGNAKASTTAAGMLRNHSAPGGRGSSSVPMLDPSGRRSSGSSGQGSQPAPRQQQDNPLTGADQSSIPLPVPIPLHIPHASRTQPADVQSLASSTTSGSGTSTNHLPQQQQPQQQAIGTRMSSWFNNFLSPPTSNNPQPQQDPTRRVGRGETASALPLPQGAGTEEAPPLDSTGAFRRSPGPRRSSSRSGTSSIHGSREDKEKDNARAGGWSSRRPRGEWTKSGVSSSDAGSTCSAGTAQQRLQEQTSPVSSLPRPIPSTATAIVPQPPPPSSYSGTSNTGPSNLMNSMTSLLTSARTKALTSYRSLVDSEAYPDGCPDPIWVRGVRFEHGSLDGGGEGGESMGMGKGKANAPVNAGKGRIGGRRGKKVSDGFGGAGGAEGFVWPAGLPLKDLISRPAVLLDFRSTVWCTYRSQYAPILALKQGEEIVPSPRTYRQGHLPPLRDTVERRDGHSAAASPPTASVEQPTTKAAAQTQALGKSSAWATWMSNISSVNITGGGGGGIGSGSGEGTTNERGLTADSGWGCMLRTGQSLLANALVCYHLGRDWRLPDTLLPDGPPLDSQAMKEKYATYIQILSWFLDDPAPVCPFSVHRMALVGKQLGKEVGEWFGPSTAAGAVKTLANGFPLCGVSIVTAVDSTIYASEVIEASHQPLGEWQELVRTMPVRTRRGAGVSEGAGRWGEQGVLILAGVRLGMEGVNPLYHDSIKALFTFPQSVGIAGGRPGSSYYFIGCQADNLFYLDPHLTRPAIPLKTRTEERDPSDPSRVVSQAPHDEQDDGSPAQVDWLLNVYTSDQLKTFHCDKVKKMPISSLDPSMLIGFLCKNHDDWLDLRERLNNLPHRIISIENTVPTWNDDSDDPDIESFTDTDVEEDSLDAPSSPSTVALEFSPSGSTAGESALAQLSTGVEFEDGDQVVLVAPGNVNSALSPAPSDLASPHLVLSEPSPPPTPTLSASQRRYVHSDPVQPGLGARSPVASEPSHPDSAAEETYDSVDVPLPATYPASNSRHRSNSSGSRTLIGNHPTGPNPP